MKEKHLGIRIPAEQFKALTKAAKKIDMTVSQIIRKLIREFLEGK